MRGYDYEESWGRFFFRLMATLVGLILLVLMGAIATEGWDTVIEWLIS